MKCRICDGKKFSMGVDLGNQPWGNHFLKKEEVGREPFYPLQVVLCDDCSLAQLNCTVPKEVMFAEHTYLSGVTKSLRQHFENVSFAVDNRFFKDRPSKSVLDIGSNDGTQLKAYQKLGFDVLGVESAKTVAQIANQNGVPTLNAFFNLETADRIGRSFDVINASGVFFHLEELHSVTEAIAKYLKNDGVFVVQFLYMKSILENGAFDQIYHEHLLYYTLKTIDALLNRHGLSLFDAEISSIHGGSVIGYIGKQNGRPLTDRLAKLKKEEEGSGCNQLLAYEKFRERIQGMKWENLRFLEKMKKEGKRVFGMGAPVKGNTLLNYFGIGADLLECLVEKNELRKGLFSPGMHLPIYMEKEMLPPDAYYVLAWNFKKEILENNRLLLQKGVEFYFPIEPNV